MYRSIPLLPYAEGLYAIMPPGLPARFYPEEEDKIHKTDDYIICFIGDVSDEMKERIINDYDIYYDAMKATGLYF